MNELFPSDTTLLAFLLASLVFAATPGPGVVYIVTRTVVSLYFRLGLLTAVSGMRTRR